MCSVYRRLKVSFLSVAVPSVLLTLASCAEPKGEYLKQRFDLGRGRQIEILASHELEVTQPFYYRVLENGKEVVSTTNICGGYDSWNLKFGYRSADSGNVVGLYQQDYPNEILAVHDFGTGQSWPGVPLDMEYEAGKEQSLRLLEKLQKEENAQKLVLETRHGCG